MKNRKTLIIILNVFPSKQKHVNFAYPAPSKQVYNLSQALAKYQKKDLNLIVITRSVNNKFSKIEKKNWELYQLPTGISFGKIKFLSIFSPVIFFIMTLSLVTYLKFKNKTDLIFANECGLPLIIGGLIKGILKIPLYVRDGSSFHTYFNKKSKKVEIAKFPLWVNFLTLHFIRKADFIQAVSLRNKLTLERLGTPKHVIKVIPNGIKIIKNINRKNQINQKLIYFYCGKLVHIKGCDTLIEAFQSFNKKFNDTELWIAGDGPFKERIQREALINDNIKYLGFVSDLDRIYRKTDIFILPSISEGLSNSLLEAMNYGLVIIGSNIPEIRGVIKNYGFLFKAGDSNSLEKILINTYRQKDDLNKFRISIRELLIKHYSYEEIAKKIILNINKIERFDS